MAKASTTSNTDVVTDATATDSPEQVGRGTILIRTRVGHEFVPRVDDVPRITSAGVKVTRAQADEVMKQAEVAGGPGYVFEPEATPENDA